MLWVPPPERGDRVHAENGGRGHSDEKAIGKELTTLQRRANVRTKVKKRITRFTLAEQRRFMENVAASNLSKN
jgi:hypothetical protein